MVNPSKKPKPNPPPTFTRQTRSTANASTSSSTAAPLPAASGSKVKGNQVVTLDDSDEEMGMYESEDSQAEFVYDSDVVISEVDESAEGEVSEGGGEAEGMTISEVEDEDEGPPAPPPEVMVPKGKGSSRKVYRDDITKLVELHGSKDGGQVRGLRREGDESINFTLMTPARKRGLPLVIMTPEVAGYPDKAQHLCYAEEDIDPATEAVLAEIPNLPPQADRSLAGVINHLKLRLILREPSPWTKLVNQDPSDNEYESDEDGFALGVGEVSDYVIAFSAALRKDLRQILDHGYRAGFHRVSELDNVVCVSVRVNQLGVDLRALQAWDSNLITGEIVYLVMLLNFGAKYPVDMDDMSRGQVRVKIGLSPKYKPDHKAIAAVFRNHSSAYTPGEFESFALSAPLDSLFAEKFQEIVACRRQYSVGWAAAEQHAFALGTKAGFDKKAAAKVDKEDKKAAVSYKMPVDPQASSATRDNFPLTAFAYLIRRFIMSPRFCLICYKETEFSSLKPFVCDSELCLFQLMNLDLAVSLENELLTNAASVDLLVSLCFSAALERGLKEASHFPYGLGIQFPERTPWSPGDPTKDFDSLTNNDEKCKAIVAMIQELPKIAVMRSWILKEDVAETDKVLYHARKLSDCPGPGGKAVSPGAWKLLRWIVASCTSYLKEITEGDELVQGLSKNYRQFKLLVGSPIKEHQLAEHVKAAKAKNANAVKYPTLHAFHGSSVKNWHAILREGLHFRETVNGRAYGHGIYFAKQGEISLGSYSVPAGSSWKQSEFTVGKVAAICEIVNLPTEYVSQNPYFVVQHTEWVQARYLIVAKSSGYTDPYGAEADTAGPHAGAHYLDLDPAHPLTLSQAKILIPNVLPKLEQLNKRLAWEEDPLNESDDELLKDPPAKAATAAPSAVKPLRSKRSLGASSSLASVGGKATKSDKGDEHDGFVPVGKEVLSMVRMLPPPKAPNRGALLSVIKEIKAMVTEQDRDGPVKCGFYFDPERSNDNVFNWIVELPIASFDQSIPLVADCQAKKVTSLLFEIRFGDNYPLDPPFFRLVYPRLLPFIQGGGGHVTGGGSICMDLLTPDAWNPVYTISAVLLQIRMAISNLEPRPARLDAQWNQPYSMPEAIEGFKRAASAHGWSVPADLDRKRY